MLRLPPQPTYKAWYKVTFSAKKWVADDTVHLLEPASSRDQLEAQAFRA